MYKSSFKTYSSRFKNFKSIYCHIASQESLFKSSEDQLKEKKKEIDAWIKTTDKQALQKAEILKKSIMSSLTGKYIIIKKCLVSESKFKSAVSDGLDKYRTENDFTKIFYTDDNLLAKRYGFDLDRNNTEIDIAKFAKLNKVTISDLDSISDTANRLFKQLSELIDNWTNNINQQLHDEHWKLVAIHDASGTKVEDLYIAISLKKVEYVSNIKITTNIFGQ